MPMTDPIKPDMFKFVSLTEAINELPYQPGHLSGLFEEKGISTTTAVIEKKGGVLSLVNPKPRGDSGQVVEGSSRSGVPFLVPHLPQRATIQADEVQGVRAFGSEDQAEAITVLRDEKLQGARSNNDYTIESHRLLAIQGKMMTANDVVENLNDKFGLTPPTPFVMGFSAASSSAARKKAFKLHLQMKEALGGTPYSGGHVYCSDLFWEALLEDKDAKETFLNTQMAADLRNDPRQIFNWGGFTWEWYSGTADVKVPNAEAIAIPTGVRGMFLTRYAPADYMETVNTLGLPYYAKAKNLDFDKGVEMEVQSNPLNICTRPNACIPVTLA